jgi:hypothetical protein
MPVWDDEAPVIHYPGDGGVIIWSKYDAKKFLCVAPPAQAALSIATKTSAEASVEAESVAVTLSGTGETAETITKLAELNERSLFLQYALYRLCESAVNGFIKGIPVEKKYQSLGDMLSSKDFSDVCVVGELPEEARASVNEVKSLPVSSLGILQMSAAFLSVAEEKDVAPAIKKQAALCGKRLIDKVNYGDYAILYRDILRTAAAMHADDRKMAEAKVALAKAEADKKKAEDEKKSAETKAREETVEQLKKTCIGPDCGTVISAWPFTHVNLCMNVTSTSIVTPVPTSATEAQVTVKDKGAQLKLPTDQWTIYEVGPTHLICPKKK